MSAVQACPCAVNTRWLKVASLQRLVSRGLVAEIGDRRMSSVWTVRRAIQETCVSWFPRYCSKRPRHAEFRLPEAGLNDLTRALSADDPAVFVD